MIMILINELIYLADTDFLECHAPQKNRDFLLCRAHEKFEFNCFQIFHEKWQNLHLNASENNGKQRKNSI